MKNNLYLIGQYLKNNKLTWVFGVILLLVLAGVIHLSHKGTLGDITSITDPFLGLSSTFIGLIIWMTQITNIEKAKLPPRMSVHFVWSNDILLSDGTVKTQENVIASCIEAPLDHEGDIRNYAQQLGRQMFECPHLNMYPYFDNVNDGIQNSSFEVNHKGKSIKINKFTCWIYLRGEKLTEVANFSKDKMPEFIQKEKHLVWYENTSMTSRNIVHFNNDFQERDLFDEAQLVQDLKQ